MRMLPKALKVERRADASSPIRARTVSVYECRSPAPPDLADGARLFLRVTRNSLCTFAGYACPGPQRRALPPAPCQGPGRSAPRAVLSACPNGVTAVTLHITRH